MGTLLFSVVSVMFHGVAYGIVLYLISVGLSITMGLMGFVNLAHGVFAMIGGYLALSFMEQSGLNFYLALILSSLIVGFASILLERFLYRDLYGGDELDQVLLTMGLVFMAMAAARYFWVPLPQRAILPLELMGQWSILSRNFPIYRLFLIATGVTLFLVLWFVVDRTGFGAKLRAAVDNQKIAQAIGINTNLLFTVTFAIGSGMAALGGGLGSELLAINPAYAMEYLIYFLIVVAVGGMGSVKGPFLAAILLGIADTACKYYIPEFGAFFIFVAMTFLLLWKPSGLLGRG